jgi:hypothetical protein
MKKLTVTLLLTALALTSYCGDVLTLNNAKVFEGKILKIKDCEVVFKAGRDKFHIPATEIFCVQFADTANKIYKEYIQLSDNDPSKCLKGSKDAALYHGKKVNHFFLGVLFGPFAMIGTAIAKQTPYKGQMTPFKSENSDLFDDPLYLECYKRKAKGQLIGMEAAGWGAWLLFAFALAASV